MNFIFETGAGDSFDKVARSAKQIAQQRNVIVEFDFNGVKCLVNEKTDPELLWKYYFDAHIMDWKEIGPDLHYEYDTDIKIELYTRRLAQAKAEKSASEAQDKEDRKNEAAYLLLTKGIEFELIPEKTDEYKTYLETNSKDGYSKAVIDYAEGWAKLMLIEIKKGRSVKDIAEETQKPMSYLGITGFQYGCVVQALSYFWQYGEDLRKWHNKEYGHEGAGVANPAILTLTT